MPYGETMDVGLVVNGKEVTFVGKGLTVIVGKDLVLGRCLDKLAWEKEQIEAVVVQKIELVGCLAERSMMGWTLVVVVVVVEVVELVALIGLQIQQVSSAFEI